jgi:hypothetical protein
VETQRRGRRKKRLKATAVQQLYQLLEEQPVKEVDPYLQMWLLCRKYGDGLTGRASLPFSGTILEQDAELMLAFTIFDDTAKEFEGVIAERKKQQEILEAKAREAFQNPSFHLPQSKSSSGGL